MKNLVGNRWADSQNAKTIKVKDPVTKKTLDTVPQSTVEDVKIVVDEAKKRKNSWDSLEISDRTNVILKFCEFVYRERQDIAELLSYETGKTISEAREDVAYLQQYVKTMVEVSKHLRDEHTQSMEFNNSSAIKVSSRTPLGIIAVILNYTSLVNDFAKYVVGALIMGNSVIVKPNALDPLTITKLAFLLRRAGVPQGVIEVIHGTDEVVSVALASNSLIDLICFSGDEKNAKEILNVASKNSTKVIINNYGNNAFIIDRDINVDSAVQKLVKMKSYNAGQEVDSPNILLVHTKVVDEFASKLSEKLSELVTGDTKDVETEIGYMMNETIAKNVESNVQKLVEHGANLYLGGTREGAFISPTIITDCKFDADYSLKGPVIPICTFETLEYAIDVANQCIDDYIAYLYVSDINTAFKLSDRLNAKKVIVFASSKTSSKYVNSDLDSEEISSNLKTMSKNKAIILEDILK